MNPEIFRIVSSVAGLGGIVVVVLLILYKKILSLQIFHNLGQRRTFWFLVIIAILTWSTAVIGMIIYYNLNKAPTEQTASQEGKILDRSNIVAMLNYIKSTNQNIDISPADTAKMYEEIISILKNQHITTDADFKSIIDAGSIAQLQGIYQDTLKRGVDIIGIVTYVPYLHRGNNDIKTEKAVRAAIASSTEYMGLNKRYSPVPSGGFKDGDLVASNGPGIYVIKNGTKCLIPDPNTWGFFEYKKPILLKQSIFKSIPTGAPIPQMRLNPNGEYERL